LSNKVTIQAATNNDIPVIHSLAHRIWRTSYKEMLSAEQMEYMLDLMYSHESLEYQIEKQQHTFLIAYEDDNPVGFAAFFPKYKISPALYRLDKIYVLPDLHGKGIGKKIIDHIISIIKQEGAAVLELNVNRKNKAVLFYERLGFSIIKEVDVAIGEGYFMNDFVMQKPIAGN
jgi:GNAT superfamily N-acetyltransferase